MATRRQAVIDLGSNSFRLVEFTWDDGPAGGWWKRTDEIREPVRIGEGLERDGPLQAEPMDRALRALDLFAHFCRATGLDDVRPVATSAIRDAANQAEFLAAVQQRTGLVVRVLSREEEARYGYLAAVNSTTLADGVALDIGGGSMQLVRVAGRHAEDSRSWRLGAVRATERYLPGKRTTPKQVKEMRAHVLRKLEVAPWLEGAGAHGKRFVGIGGTVRNLAVASALAAGQPTDSVQGVCVGRKSLAELIERLIELPAAERAKVPGIKPDRADLILAGAVVIDCVLEAGQFAELEATQAGLREGVFFETLLGGDALAQPLFGAPATPLFDDVRRDGVRNLAAQYESDAKHPEHVASLCLGMWDALGQAGCHKADPGERDLLWAAALLHDIGTAVDYDDHHRHSRYLVLNAGLPGFSARETALVGQMVRYHRKGSPGLGEAAPLARDGDEAVVRRCAALLRVVEQLERSRDQTVRSTSLQVRDGTVEVTLDADGDVSLARWAAERQADVFERAFGKRLALVGS